MNRVPRNKSTRKAKTSSRANSSVSTSKSSSSSISLANIRTYGTATRNRTSSSTASLKRSISSTRSSPQQSSVASRRTVQTVANAAPKSFLDMPRLVSEPHLPKNATRKGFDLRLLDNGKETRPDVTITAPQTNMVILPASSKIGRKYVEDIRSGKVILNMYKNLTKKETQPIYTPSFSYVHSFRIHERNHRDFLKRIALIETKLTQRFGSTYYLHVGRPLKKFRHKWTVLRSAFVHKKAQDTYEYKQNEYTVKISYAFAITDPVVNDFIYEQLKKTIIAAGGAHSFGYTIKHWTEKERPSQFTSLSDPILDTDGVVPEIPQVKYANYVGHQEMLRKYCEENDLNYDDYAGDPDNFPLRHEVLEARRLAEQRLNIYDLRKEQREAALKASSTIPAADPESSDWSAGSQGKM